MKIAFTFAFRDFALSRASSNLSTTLTSKQSPACELAYSTLTPDLLKKSSSKRPYTGRLVRNLSAWFPIAQARASCMVVADPEISI